MIPTIEQIELAIMKYPDFNYRQNLMVFRVSDFSGIVNHECDCLIMSKSGYLTEIEIKRSYSDFLADFKKKHEHKDERINRLFYCVHTSFYEKVLQHFIDIGKVPTAIYTYDDDCRLRAEIGFYGISQKMQELGKEYDLMCGYGRKLFIEEKYQLARLGAMRYKNMTERIIKLID